jgi:small subunit ribosomal protein S17
MTETATAPAEKARQKEFVGRVVSNKMQKTVVVAVEKTRHHRLYKRAIRLTKKYYAHDESDSLQVGDQVRIVETRPLSKLKRWRVAEVMRKTQGGPVEIAEPEVDVAADAGDTGRSAAVDQPTASQLGPTTDQADSTADKQEEA